MVRGRRPLLRCLRLVGDALLLSELKIHMNSKRTYGLLGKNINYSLSPCMHNAAFKRFNIPAEYKLFDVEEKGLDSFFQERVRGGELKGFNVTVPYKMTICDMLKLRENCFLDEMAGKLGTVNTVKIEENGLRGFNTDGKGFCEALSEEIDPGFKALTGKKVLVLGAGGASRAICFSLASSGAALREISVFDIDKAKLSSMVEFFEGCFGADVLTGITEEDIPRTLTESGLLINATPLGTREGDPSPVRPDLLHENIMVYDLVYARETELLQAAKKRGLKAAGGLGMLVNQAALAFDIWSVENFYLGDIKEVMKKAAREELKKRGKDQE